MWRRSPAGPAEQKKPPTCAVAVVTRSSSKCRIRHRPQVLIWRLVVAILLAGVGLRALLTAGVGGPGKFLSTSLPTTTTTTKTRPLVRRPVSAAANATSSSSSSSRHAGARSALSSSGSNRQQTRHYHHHRHHHHQQQPDYLSARSVERQGTTNTTATTSSSKRPFLMDADDRLVAVTAVIVMGAGPARAADAARFLHARYPYVQELVLWNNRNQSMNSHMLPYDLAVRYVMSPRDHGPYARVLGCMLARHEICFFQHETLRPTILDSLMTAFLREVVVVAGDGGGAAVASKPASISGLHVVVATADARFVRQTRRVRLLVANDGEPCIGRLSHIDWDAGALAHKDVIKAHLRTLNALEMGGSGNSSIVIAAAGSATEAKKALTSDLLLSYGLRRQPILLTYTMPALQSRRALLAGYPPSRQIAEAAVEVITGSLALTKSRTTMMATPDGHSDRPPLRLPCGSTSLKKRPQSQLHHHARTFKAPCVQGRCTLVTNMRALGDDDGGGANGDAVGAQDELGAVGDHSRQHSLLSLSKLLASRATTKMTEEDLQLETSLSSARAPTNQYAAAVDGDTGTAWIATWDGGGAAAKLDDDDDAEELDARPYVSLELLRPTVVTGVRLVFDAKESMTMTMMRREPPRLFYAFQGLGGSADGANDTTSTRRFRRASGCVSKWDPVAGAPQQQQSSPYEDIGDAAQVLALTVSCRSARVMGVRLYFVSALGEEDNHPRIARKNNGTSNKLQLAIAELSLTRLRLANATAAAAGTLPGSSPAPPSRLLPHGLRIAYALTSLDVGQDGDNGAGDTGTSSVNLENPLRGSTLALLEEACELGASGGGSDGPRTLAVTLVFFARSRYHRHQHPRSAIHDDLATAFSVASGSSCDLRRAVDVRLIYESFSTATKDDAKWDVVFLESSSSSSSSSIRALAKLFTASGQAQQIKNNNSTPVMVLRCLTTPRCRLRDDDNRDGHVDIDSTTAFDAITLPDQPSYYSYLMTTTTTVDDDDKPTAAAAQTPDVRIVYPLRTLSVPPPPPALQGQRQRPATTAPAMLVPTPTTPPLEELVLLTTPTTTRSDLRLFDAHAAPILQAHGVSVREVNVTTLVRMRMRMQRLSTRQSSLGGGKQLASGHAQSPQQQLNAVLTRSKWATLRELVRDVAIYPARCLWILDATGSAAYYASAASADGARFVASSSSMPQHVNRLLAWNATCDWTADGFAGKAHELIAGRFFWSSAVGDRAYLQSGARDIVVAEWPLKREMAPVANTVRDHERYIASLLAVRGYMRLH